MGDSGNWSCGTPWLSHITHTHTHNYTKIDHQHRSYWSIQFGVAVLVEWKIKVTQKTHRISVNNRAQLCRRGYKSSRLFCGLSLSILSVRNGMSQNFCPDCVRVDALWFDWRTDFGLELFVCSLHSVTFPSSFSDSFSEVFLTRKNFGDFFSNLPVKSQEWTGERSKAEFWFELIWLTELETKGLEGNNSLTHCVLVDDTVMEQNNHRNQKNRIDFHNNSKTVLVQQWSVFQWSVESSQVVATGQCSLGWY